VKKGNKRNIEEAFPEGKLDLKNKFVELRAKGLSIRKISERLRHSPQTCLNWQGELEEEIAKLKALELEALYEKYRLLKEHRVKLLGEQIKAIQDELKKRDLSQTSTDKLLELQLKYLEEAIKECVEPRIFSREGMGRFSNGSRSKLDSEDISLELALVLLKYRKGLLSDTQARQEISLLQAILKAEDQTEIQKKLDKLEVLLDRRR
jgi:transposase